MDFVVIFGPPAVGKMSVGMELERLTSLKLFHNHMSIEFVHPFFNFGTKTGQKLVGEFRRRLFEEVARSDLKGLIFTYVWAFDEPKEKEYIDSICEIFKKNGARISFVELSAPLEVRLERNRTELRLAHKASKRDVDWSEKNLLQDEKDHQMNSSGTFFYPDRYLRIENAKVSPTAAAEQIVRHFGL